MKNMLPFSPKFKVFEQSRFSKETVWALCWFTKWVFCIVWLQLIIEMATDLSSKV